MPVKNIECQIAQAQIARLLAGDTFANEVLADLEEHIASCEECRNYVSGRRTALEAMVSEEDLAREQPVVEPVANPRPSINLLQAQLKPLMEDLEPEPEPEVEQPRPAPKRKPRPAAKRAVVESPAAQAPAQQNFWKPLAYSGALALVLFAMSFLMKNPTAMFGNKMADDGTPAASKPEQPATIALSDSPGAKEETGEPAEADAGPSVLLKGQADESEPIERDAAAAPEDAAPTVDETPVVEQAPKPAVAKPAPPKAKPAKATANSKPKATRKAAPKAQKPRPRRKVGSLRFYDSQGRPLN